MCVKAIDDLRNIAQLGYDKDEDRETLAQSLEEVIKYIHIAAILSSIILTLTLALRQRIDHSIRSLSMLTRLERE